MLIAELIEIVNEVGQQQAEPRHVAGIGAWVHCLDPFGQFRAIHDRLPALDKDEVTKGYANRPRGAGIFHKHKDLRCERIGREMKSGRPCHPSHAAVDKRWKCKRTAYAQRSVLQLYLIPAAQEAIYNVLHGNGLRRPDFGDDACTAARGIAMRMHADTQRKDHRGYVSEDQESSPRTLSILPLPVNLDLSRAVRPIL